VIRSGRWSRRSAARHPRERRAKFTARVFDYSLPLQVHADVENEVSMAIDVRVEGFPHPYEGLNNRGKRLSVTAADVARAAATVGGPVNGTAWRRTQRRVGIIATVHAALAEKRGTHPIRTSTLYARLETTEKSGVSFRLGMAFAALVAEQILAIRVLEHLNHSNSVVFPNGGKRRADLFGLDHRGDCHVIEAKSRTHGPDEALVNYAKSQAANIAVVDVHSGRYVPKTRSAAVADLSRSPVRVLLADPPEEATPEKPYRIDTEQVIAHHYSVAPDLVELRGKPQDPPTRIDADVVGAYLPGTDVWLGVKSSLFGESRIPWRKRIQGDDVAQESVLVEDDTVSVGRDGHVLQLGPEFSQLYEDWRTREDESARNEG
jgi:hypothetical protein